MFYLLLAKKVFQLNIFDINTGDTIINADCTLDLVSISSQKEGARQQPKKSSQRATISAADQPKIFYLVLRKSLKLVFMKYQ